MEYNKRQKKGRQGASIAECNEREAAVTSHEWILYLEIYVCKFSAFTLIIAHNIGNNNEKASAGISEVI